MNPIFSSSFTYYSISPFWKWGYVYGLTSTCKSPGVSGIQWSCPHCGRSSVGILHSCSYSFRTSNFFCCSPFGYILIEEAIILLDNNCTCKIMPFFIFAKIERYAWRMLIENLVQLTLVMLGGFRNGHCQCKEIPNYRSS